MDKDKKSKKIGHVRYGATLANAFMASTAFVFGVVTIAIGLIDREHLPFWIGIVLSVTGITWIIEIIRPHIKSLKGD